MGTVGRHGDCPGLKVPALRRHSCHICPHSAQFGFYQSPVLCVLPHLGFDECPHISIDREAVADIAQRLGFGFDHVDQPQEFLFRGPSTDSEWGWVGRWFEVSLF